MPVAVSETALTMRKHFGEWLKKSREAAGVTQLGLAQAMGHNYVSMVSQVERGRSLIPSPDLARWADGINVKHKIFVLKYLYWCHPEASAMLTGVDPFTTEGLDPIPKTSATNPGGHRPKAKK